MSTKPIGLLLALLLALPAAVSAQQELRITGTVASAAGDPLPGVAVYVAELAQVGVGTVTSASGAYALVVPAKHVRGQTVTLTAQTIGYKTTEFQIQLTGEARTHDFTLASDALHLDQIVVTGVARAVPKEKLAFTVDQISTEELEVAMPSTSPVTALQGRVAGAYIVKNDGTPGKGASVRLRGATSITGTSEPLYIVDGVILGASQIDIESQDIESMEVLKGAAAASIYGSRAQNGVIQITTKRGGNLGLGQTKLSFRNEYGIHRLTNADVKSRSHSLMMAEEAFVDPDGLEVKPGDFIRVDDEGNRYWADYRTASTERFAPGISFKDNAYPVYHDHVGSFYDPGNFTRSYLTVSNRHQNGNFFLSLGNTQESGVIKDAQGYNRKNVRLNLDQSLLPNLRLSASGYLSLAERDEPLGGRNPFPVLFFIDPSIDLNQFDEDGDYVWQPDPTVHHENPLYLLSKSDIDIYRQRVMGSLGLSFTPVDWLDVESGFSYDRNNRDEERFFDKGFNSNRARALRDGRIQEASSRQTAINANLRATATRRFGELTTRTTANFLMEKETYDWNWMRGDGLGAKGVRTFNNVTGTISTRSTERDVRGLYGFLSTQLDYKDRYVADFLVRRDGSSLFGADERWHTYFRGSAAYRMGQESWFPAKDKINEFKLRYSMGTAGARPNFAAQYETYSVRDGNIVRNTLGNRFLKPELQTEQEFGLEMAFFDRVSLQLVHARSTVTDQLLRVPLMGFYGFSHQWQNAGTLESESWEANLQTVILDRRDHKLSFGLVADRTRQEITDFDNVPFRTGPGKLFYIREGENMGTMYGNYYIRGYDRLPEEMQQYRQHFQRNDEGYLVAVGEGNSWKDGISKELWGTKVDVDGDGKGDYRWGMPIQYVEPDGNTFVKIGSSLPELNLGLSTNWRWKGLATRMVWSSEIGGDIYNYVRHWTGNRHATADEGGKPDALKKPTAYYNTFRRFNNYYVEDGTYLKLREVALTYKLGEQRLQSLPFVGSHMASMFDGVGLSVTGRNLLTFTNYKGYDPEVGMGNATMIRYEDFRYPNYRTFTFKLDFDF